MKVLILAACISMALCDVSHIVPQNNEREAKIVKQDLDVGAAGTYQYGYETENGISASEQGELKTIDAETAAEVVHGEAKWTSPEGQQIHLTYTADENGYQPQGEHLPTSPPIPEAILRALQYIRDHPPAPESAQKQN